MVEEKELTPKQKAAKRYYLKNKDNSEFIERKKQIQREYEARVRENKEKLREVNNKRNFRYAIKTGKIKTPKLKSKSKPPTKIESKPIIKTEVQNQTMGYNPRIEIVCGRQFTPTERKWINDFLAKKNKEHNG